MKASAQAADKQQVADTTVPIQRRSTGIVLANNRPSAVAQRRLQGLIDSSPRQQLQRQAVAQLAAKPNRTGLPDKLKAGVEQLSGHSLDDVRVHYNSAQPAQLQAHAYAQGNAIHLGPGQEQHLPHEAWHVVQQKQGRVRATRQLKGVHVNDDEGLEQEATVMGARAAAGAQPPVGEGAPQPLSAGSSTAKGVHQLVTAIKVGEGNFKKLYTSGFSPEARQETGIGNELSSINWPKVAESIYESIKEARTVVESQKTVDEDEIEANEEFKLILKEKEVRVDELVAKGNGLIEAFDRIIPKTGRASRSASPNKRLGALSEKFAKLRKDLTTVGDELKLEIKAGKEGGFSAVGRATDAKEKAVIKDKSAPDSKPIHNEFIDELHITSGDASGKLLPQKNVHKADDLKANAGAMRVLVGGQTYGGSEFKMAATKRQSLIDALPLSAPKGFGPQEYKAGSKFMAVPREPGQEAMMAKTNARGYAWASGQAAWNTTQWEWLHIRGASLGGDTDAKNLVLGTRDSNTHMMPFESNLKALLKIAREYPAHYTGLKVTWALGAPAGYGAHSRASIMITWEMMPTSRGKKYTGSAVFRPLKSGSVLTKIEVEAIQNSLKTQNESLKPTVTQQDAPQVSSSVNQNTSALTATPSRSPNLPKPWDAPGSPSFADLAKRYALDSETKNGGTPSSKLATQSPSSQPQSTTRQSSLFTLSPNSLHTPLRDRSSAQNGTRSSSVRKTLVFNTPEKTTGRRPPSSQSGSSYAQQPNRQSTRQKNKPKRYSPTPKPQSTSRSRARDANPKQRR